MTDEEKEEYFMIKKLKTLWNRVYKIVETKLWTILNIV